MTPDSNSKGFSAVADHRHKRDTDARWTSVKSRFMPHRRAALVAAPLATLATIGAVGVGVVATSSPSLGDQLQAGSALNASISGANDRGAPVSRSEDRTQTSAFEATATLSGVQDTLEAQQARREAAAERRAARAEAKRAAAAVAAADTKLWATEELNVWTASAGGENVGLVDALDKVLVTGRSRDGRDEIVVDGDSRWVTSGYLTDEKPESGPSLGGSCSNGSSIDAGRESLYAIHDVVCANWPQITSYGTWRGDGEHGQGRAVDIMVSGDTGWAVAEFLRANAGDLGIEYLIYSQKIWSVERSGEGWRSMSDRGSITANHYDHVHVTVY